MYAPTKRPTKLHRSRPHRVHNECAALGSSSGLCDGISKLSRRIHVICFSLYSCEEAVVVDLPHFAASPEVYPTHRSGPTNTNAQAKKCSYHLKGPTDPIDGAFFYFGSITSATQMALADLLRLHIRACTLYLHHLLRSRWTQRHSTTSRRESRLGERHQPKKSNWLMTRIAG